MKTERDTGKREREELRKGDTSLSNCSSFSMSWNKTTLKPQEWCGGDGDILENIVLT